MNLLIAACRLVCYRWILCQLLSARTMLHVRFKLLLLMTAHLPLLCTAKSHTEAPSSSSGRDKVKPDSCGKGTD